MPRGLIIDNDQLIASWTYEKFNAYPLPINKALGVLDDTGTLVGGILFHNFNGVNVELSYYGPSTLTPGIVRAIARTTIEFFNAARLTVVTSQRNRRLIRSLLKIGFKLEGVQRCFYGHEDNRRNTGVRLAAFRDKLDRVAYRTTHEKKSAL
jgi:RimJ/RimL family protein N-acetyltransferase